MKRNGVKGLLYQQLELLAEKSKDTYPASNELSHNSLAMARLSNELFKRKCFSMVLFIAFGYFIVRIAVHGK